MDRPCHHQTMAQPKPDSRRCCIPQTQIRATRTRCTTSSVMPIPTHLGTYRPSRSVHPSPPIHSSVPTASLRSRSLLVVSGPPKFLLPLPSTNHSHSSLTPFHFTILKTLLPFIKTVLICLTLSLPVLMTQHHLLHPLTPH